MIFARESCAQIIPDLPALIWDHAREANETDALLHPDYDAYCRLEAAGALRIYSVRVDGHLSGYAVFLLAQSLHYASVRCAHQSLLYVLPGLRRSHVARELIAFTEADLWPQVDVITHSVPFGHGQEFAMSRLFEHLGYQHQERVYSKRRPT